MSFLSFFHRLGKAKPVTYEVTRPIQVGDIVIYVGVFAEYYTTEWKVIEKLQNLNFVCERITGFRQCFHASEIERIP